MFRLIEVTFCKIEDSKKRNIKQFINAGKIYFEFKI